MTSSVGKDGVDTIAGQMLYSFTKERPDSDELTSAAAFQTVQVVDALENESNDAYIEVTASDRAGNTRTSIQLLKIDVTNPVLSVQFDDHEPLNGRYYRRKRTAVLHVTERNFDPSAVQISIQKDGKPYACQMPRWTSDGIEHKAEIVLRRMEVTGWRRSVQTWRAMCPTRFRWSHLSLTRRRRRYRWH